MSPKNIKQKVLLADTTYKKQDIKICAIISFWQCHFGSSKLANLQISNFHKNCINFKQNSHSNNKQENHRAAYYITVYFTKDLFQGASSQAKQKNFKNFQKFSEKHLI